MYNKSNVLQQSSPERLGQPANDDRLIAYLVFSGAVALVLGSFLPWAEFSAPFYGTVTRSGTGGGDGYFTILSGAGAAYFGFDLYRKGHRLASPWRLLIPGLSAAAVVIYDYLDIQNRIGDANRTGEIVASYGSGLYVVGAGVVAILLGAYLTMRRRQESGRNAAPPLG